MAQARGGFGCAGPQTGACGVTILTPQHACRPERCAGRFPVERSKLYLEEERPEDKRREVRAPAAVRCMVHGAWCGQTGASSLESYSLVGVKRVFSYLKEAVIPRPFI